MIGLISSPNPVVGALLASFVTLDCSSTSIRGGSDDRGGEPGLASAASLIRSASVFSPSVGPLLPDQPHGVSQDPPGDDIPYKYFA